MDSFFGKNGTMQQSMNVANSIAQFGGSATNRLGALGSLVKAVMALFI